MCVPLLAPRFTPLCDLDPLLPSYYYFVSFCLFNFFLSAVLQFHFCVLILSPCFHLFNPSLCNVLLCQPQRSSLSEQLSKEKSAIEDRLRVAHSTAQRARERAVDAEVCVYIRTVYCMLSTCVEAFHKYCVAENGKYPFNVLTTYSWLPS